MADQTSIYDDSFFRAQIEGSDRSAQVIVPIVMSLLPQTKSVIDIGCGTGIWLKNFKRNGVAKVVGVDSASPETNLLQIRPEEYHVANLEKPLEINGRFDLCVCLEVAEHLPAAAAAGLVHQLCRQSDVVLFSAAIPGQGGTHHVNERWQSFWAALFAGEGYVRSDALRTATWYNTRVSWWYAQNVFLFIRESRRDILDAVGTGEAVPLDVVHPRCFEEYRRMLEELRGRYAALRKAAGLVDMRGKRPDGLSLKRKNDMFKKRGAALSAAIRNSKQAQSHLDRLRRSGGFRIARLASPGLGGHADSISVLLKDIAQLRGKLRNKSRDKNQKIEKK